MEISVVLCTRNRLALLKGALASLLTPQQSLSPDRFEILVVDNGPGSDTAAWVTELASHRSNVRLLLEPRIGSNFARNRGWRAARGRWVAFLDDDATAHSQWLERMAALFSILPANTCLGGRVEPIWEEHPPAWYSPEMGDAFSLLDLSAGPGFLPSGQSLNSCNLAIPRQLLEAAGGFNNRIQRQEGGLLSNDETLLLRTLGSHGARFYYHPELRVFHHVSRSRLSKHYLRRRQWWQGVSDSWMEEVEQSLSRAQKIRRAARLSKELIAHAPALVKMRLPTNHPPTLQKQLQTYSEVGRWTESLASVVRGDSLPSYRRSKDS